MMNSEAIREACRWMLHRRRARAARGEGERARQPGFA